MKKVMKCLLYLILIFYTIRGYAILDEILANKNFDFDSLEVFLITLGPSDLLYTQGGHNGFHLVAKSEGLSNIAEWGNFYFGNNLLTFITNFYQGHINYEFGLNSFGLTLRIQKMYFKREILYNKINLSKNQKIKLLKILAWWEKDKNKIYKYHVWKKNCSNVLASVLNEVTSNYPKNRLSNESHRKSYREYWLEIFSHWTLVTIATNLLLNSDVDRKINKWEESYIPIKLLENLKTLPMISDSGRPINNKKLLEPTKFLDRRTIERPSLTTIYIIHLILGLLLSIPLFIFIFILKKTNKISTPKKIIVYFMIASIPSLTSSFIYGFLSTFSTLFSERTYFHIGYNLLIYNPLDLLYLIFFVSLTFISKKKHYVFLFQSLRTLSYFHLAGAFVYVTLGFFNLISLNTNFVSLVFLPSIAIFHLLFLSLKENFQPTFPKLPQLIS